MNFTYVYRHPSTSKEPILQNDDLPENIEEYGLSDAREDASSPRGDTSTDLQATSTTAPPCESSGSSKRQQISVGPSLAVYDEDKIGDGDQSPITDPTLQHMHEELFASG